MFTAPLCTDPCGGTNRSGCSVGGTSSYSNSLTGLETLTGQDDLDDAALLVDFDTSSWIDKGIPCRKRTHLTSEDILAVRIYELQKAARKTFDDGENSKKCEIQEIETCKRLLLPSLNWNWSKGNRKRPQRSF